MRFYNNKYECPSSSLSHSNPTNRYRKLKIAGLTSGCTAAAGKLMQDGISSTQLLQMLLHREKRLYQDFPLSLAKGEGVIGWRDRNRECSWLCTASHRLGLDLDTTSLSIAIFDKVVTTTKVPSKYVNCVAVASLSIAKKLCEDHEEDAPVFLGRLRLEYSAQELKRMEMRILQCLQWDAYLPNIYRFIECLLSQIGASFLLPSIKSHTESIICDSTLTATFRPSVLALSLVSLLIEATNRHWQQPAHTLAKLCKIPFPEVVRCRQRISNLWSRRVLPMPSTFHLLSADDDEMDVEDMNVVPHTSQISPITSSSASEHITSPAPRQLQPTPC